MNPRLFVVLYRPDNVSRCEDRCGSDLKADHFDWTEEGRQAAAEFIAKHQFDSKTSDNRATCQWEVLLMYGDAAYDTTGELGYFDEEADPRVHALATIETRSQGLLETKLREYADAQERKRVELENQSAAQRTRNDHAQLQALANKLGMIVVPK